MLFRISINKIFYKKKLFFACMFKIKIIFVQVLFLLCETTAETFKDFCRFGSAKLYAY